MDTIFALATAQGRAGVAIVRLSGPAAHSVAALYAGPLPLPRRAARRPLRDARGNVLDDILLLTFDTGASFTGEEVAELHLHGSIAIINAVLELLAQTDGCRLAEAGEFTRRALENGCMDLVEVEGLADLIDAETDAQRRQAMQVYSGSLSTRTEAWRTSLIRAAALIEATIDFADEEIPENVFPEVSEIVHRLIDEFTVEAAGVAQAERLRAGFEVALIGPPNAGKSTLLNAIARRDVAITSEVAGTTRDIIELRTDINGLPVTFLDTAGIRETDDTVERIGVTRALDRARAADLRVFLEPISELEPRKDDLSLLAKADIRQGVGLAVSARTGAGVTELLDSIGEILQGRLQQVGAATHLRHRLALTSAAQMLRDAQEDLLDPTLRAEMAADNLRSAIAILDSLVGRIGVEDLLGEIFSSFCIGK
ncbi:MAG: tRNA uridine-5-carboxymethylaminomethyl(34) synthesis GTPase MnmE [Celeribacter sp.]|jgi:tRNA modification GTPase